MRIGILHPGPFRGGAPAVTAGQVRKKQCGKAGRSPAVGWVTPRAGSRLGCVTPGSGGNQGGPRVNRWRRLRVMRGAAVPPTPRARADASLFRAPQPAPPRRARWRFPHRGLGTRGSRSAQARVRLRGASSGAGALRGTGPGAEGRGRRPRCHRVALSWGPSAFGSSAANCWRRYRPNDARGPPPSPTSGHPSSGRLRAALSRHVHRGSRGDAHGPVRLSLRQPRTPERPPSPRVAPFSFRCVDA